MSEPGEKAKFRGAVTEKIRWYSVHDDRIDHESDCYAAASGEGWVLIDPLPLFEKDLKALQPVHSIVLTAACHQRAAWRYRRRFQTKVYAPVHAGGLEERPDFLYGRHCRLPGGLTAIHAPGPTEAHYALYDKSSPGIVFCGDLVMRDEGGALEFVPGDYQDNPSRTRRSVSRLNRTEFRVLCMNHGRPEAGRVHEALEHLLEEDARHAA